MAELSYIIKTKYLESLDSLKNTSYDKENNIYMCQSNMEVIDFDKLTLLLYPNKQPSSYDTLLIEETQKDIFYIEFKNQKVADVNNTKLQKKVIDSDQTIVKICTENKVKKKDYRFILCVVSKQEKGEYRYRRFKDKVVHYGLDIFKGKYFDQIITNNVTYFQKEFQKKYECR